jgi:hypothetical protein
MMDFLCFLQEAQMDRDDEMMDHQFLEEEAAAATKEDKHMAILLSVTIAGGEGSRSHTRRVIGWAKEIEA